MRKPEKIGRYEIVEQIGQGGMAVVYLGRDPLMERQVAIKLLPRQLTFDKALRGRFQKEARIVASLEHPAIVPVHDFGEFNDQPYLVMRYMLGGSLGQRLQGEQQTLTKVVRTLLPLAPALDKAHAQHIIHRDLKPDNILFDGDGNPYLSDFGIARLAEGTQTQSIMGTPAYMSPEQIKGDVKLDGRSDIYALGVILFEMLSGEQPYTAETPTQVMMKHVLDPVPVIMDRVSNLPPMTQFVIERAMAKERDERYSSAQELVEAVRELLTASQEAEVGAAFAGTMIEETMLELPKEEIDPLATVVEQRVPASGSTDFEREARAAALYAQLNAAVEDKDWVEALAIGAQLKDLDPNYRDVEAIVTEAQAQLTMPLATMPPPEAQSGWIETEAAAEAVQKPASRGRKVLLLGCGLFFLIMICGLVFAGIINMVDDGGAADAPASSGVASSLVEDLQPVVTEEAEAVPTAGEETAPAEPTVAPTEPTLEVTSAAEAVLPPGVLFADDFSGKGAVENWDLWQDESAEFAVGNGHMIAMGYDPSTLAWVKQNDSYTDLELRVTADIMEGGRSAFFGVVFDGDGDNYVGCFVQGDNSAYCGQALDGETEFGDWVIVDLSILKDNEILFVVSNQEWAMSVNDRCLGSGMVNFEPQGQPGLVVSTADSEVIASIAYDDFQVFAPTEMGLALLGCEPEYFE